MWVQKKLSELAAGDEFKYGLYVNDIYCKIEMQHTSPCCVIKKGSFKIHATHVMPELVTVYVEAPKVKLSDVKHGQCFRFVDDIKSGHYNTYLMTDKPFTTVTVRHRISDSIGKLTKWVDSFATEEVEIVELGM